MSKKYAAILPPLISIPSSRSIDSPLRHITSTFIFHIDHHHRNIIISIPYNNNMFPKTILTFLAIATFTSRYVSQTYSSQSFFPDHHTDHHPSPNSVIADLHYQMACVNDRDYKDNGQDGVATSFTINADATGCACNYYLHRNTGRNQWDKCPDCWFDGTFCNSAGWHMGGDEVSFSHARDWIGLD